MVCPKCGDTVTFGARPIRMAADDGILTLYYISRCEGCDWKGIGKKTYTFDELDELDYGYNDDCEEELE